MWNKKMHEVYFETVRDGPCLSCFFLRVASIETKITEKEVRSYFLKSQPEPSALWVLPEARIDLGLDTIYQQRHRKSCFEKKCSMQGTDPPSTFEMRSAVMVSGSLSEGPGVEGRIFDGKVMHGMVIHRMAMEIAHHSRCMFSWYPRSDFQQAMVDHDRSWEKSSILVSCGQKQSCWCEKRQHKTSPTTNNLARFVSLCVWLDKCWSGGPARRIVCIVVEDLEI